MEKLHFNPGYPAENFDLDNIRDPSGENQRSKSVEHSQRFIKSENSQKTEKIEEIKS